MKASEIPLPDAWPALVRRAVLHIVSFAHYAIICARSCAADSKIQYESWCKRRKIKRRYGAVGKYGSIAVIERFIRSLKDECTRQILLPLNLNEMRKELALYTTWYNEFCPHQTLKGRVPQEIYNNSPPAIPMFDCPNFKLPEMRLKVSYLEGRKHVPLIQLKIA